MIKENNIAIDIKRTQRRKSISITIADNRVKITVPYHLPQDQIDQLLKKKSKFLKSRNFEMSKIPKFQNRVFSAEIFLDQKFSTNKFSKKFEFFFSTKMFSIQFF